VIASITFDYLVVKTKGKNGSGILPFSIIATGTILLIGLIVLVQDQTIQILWGVLAFIITGVIIFVAIKPGYNKYLDWIMVGVLVIDLVGAGLQAYHVDEKGSQILGRALSELDGKQGDFRFYSPSFSIEQHLAAEFDLELADGVDPMQLSSYVNFMEDATGVEQDSYSVTIPAFETGNPAVDNIQAVPDSALLGLLNVKYVVSEFAVAAPGLELFRNQDDLYIYKNGNFRPRAWIEAPDGDGSILAPAEILNKSPNRIIVEATGPGVLVVSEIQYPGWQVYIDGERESIEISREILRSVTLGDGKHQIEFRFRPASVYFGIILSACGWMIAVYVLFRRRFFVMKNDLRDE
jgi:hypothetical protein